MAEKAICYETQDGHEVVVAIAKNDKYAKELAAANLDKFYVRNAKWREQSLTHFQLGILFGCGALFIYLAVLSWFSP